MLLIFQESDHTASGLLAVNQDDIISTLLSKQTQDVLQVKQLLSTIKSALNPRFNIEMFDCIIKCVRQCSNVESTLIINLLKCII